MTRLGRRLWQAFKTAPSPEETRATILDNVLAIYRRDMEPCGSAGERTAFLYRQPRVKADPRSERFAVLTFDEGSMGTSGHDDLEAARAACVAWAGSDRVVSFDTLPGMTQTAFFNAVFIGEYEPYDDQIEWASMRRGLGL